MILHTDLQTGVPTYLVKMFLFSSYVSMKSTRKRSIMVIQSMEQSNKRYLLTASACRLWNSLPNFNYKHVFIIMPRLFSQNIFRIYFPNIYKKYIAMTEDTFMECT